MYNINNNTEIQQHHYLLYKVILKKVPSSNATHL